MKVNSNDGSEDGKELKVSNVSNGINVTNKNDSDNSSNPNSININKYKIENYFDNCGNNSNNKSNNNVSSSNCSNLSNGNICSSNDDKKNVCIEKTEEKEQKGSGDVADLSHDSALKTECPQSASPASPPPLSLSLSSTMKPLSLPFQLPGQSPLPPQISNQEVAIPNSLVQSTITQFDVNPITHSFILGPSTILTLLMGDLTKALVDCIVNAANEIMLGGGKL